MLLYRTKNYGVADSVRKAKGEYLDKLFKDAKEKIRDTELAKKRLRDKEEWEKSLFFKKREENELAADLLKTQSDLLFKYKKDEKLRRNPNDESIIEDIRKEFLGKGGKSFEVLNGERRMGKGSSYSKKTNSMKTIPIPAIAAHENNHFKHDLLGEGIDALSYNLATTKNMIRSPKKVFEKLKYVRDEEGRANKGAFRDMFLNSKTGGRDWRTTHHVTKRSNNTYNANLGIDIQKSGLQDLDYGMSPEVLSKLKENAKKLGIDLDKSAKVQYTKATPEERKAIEKYVKENEDKF